MGDQTVLKLAPDSSTIVALLVSMLRPKMKLQGTEVRATLELSDLTSAPRAKCMAMYADPAHITLITSVKVRAVLVRTTGVCSACSACRAAFVCACKQQGGHTGTRSCN